MCSRSCPRILVQRSSELFFFYLLLFVRFRSFEGRSERSKESTTKTRDELNVTYVEDIARKFASISSVTYCEKNLDTVLNWTCQACQEADTPLVPGSVRLIDGSVDGSSRILIGKLEKQKGCVMAFRGSENVLNWIDDFKAWEVKPKTFNSTSCKGCKVHSGFYNLWEDVKNLTLAALEEVGCTVESDDNLVYITGHSLGAALTHIAMFSLKDRGWRIEKTYSFEAPRVGNKNFADAFVDLFEREFPVFRITHHEDPIVHLPPESFGYYHVATEVYYDQHGNYTVCDGTGEDDKCADQYWDVPQMILTNAGDHCASPLVPNGDLCNPVGCV